MTEKKWVIEVNGKEFDLSEKGYPQLQRVSMATSFINTYGKQAIRDLDLGSVEGATQTDTLSLLISLVGNIDERGLIWLGQIVTLEDEEFVTENFDITWIVDGLRILFSTPAFSKLADSFFGGRGQ